MPRIRTSALSWAVALLLALVALLALAPLAGAAGTGSITGTVKHGASGLEGVTVDVYTSSGHEFVSSAVSGGGGSYEVSGLGAGTYTVEFLPGFGSIYAPQYYKEAHSLADASVVVVDEGKATTAVNGSLHEGGVVSGTVTSAHGGPLAGVTVVVYSEEFFGGFDTTNAKGEYEIKDLAQGSYKVEFFPAEGLNFVPQVYDEQPSSRTATLVAVEEEHTKTINAALLEGGVITGTVTDAATHKPLANVDVNVANALGVEFFGGFAVTNGNGEYTVVGLGSGSYNVEFEAEGHLTQTDNGVGVVRESTTSGINAALIPDAPNNTGSPLASGTPAVGQMLSCSNGSWTGLPSIKYTYRWLRDGSGIEGASGSTYTVQSADQGHGLSCEVTATNSSGHASANSNTLSVPAPPPPPPPPTPQIAVPASTLIVFGGGAQVRITCLAAPCTGTIELTKQIVVRHRKRNRTVLRRVTLILGKVSFQLAAGHSGTFVIHLTKTGRSRLAAARHHRLAVVLVGSLAGGRGLRETVLLKAVRRT